MVRSRRQHAPGDAVDRVREHGAGRLQQPVPGLGGVDRRASAHDTEGSAGAVRGDAEGEMGKRPRRHVSLKTKLASALLALGHIPYEHAKLMTADQIISLYQWDHNALHALGGVDLFWNLTQSLIVPHRVKSKKDKSIVSKVVRLRRAQSEVVCILLKPTGHRRKRSWPEGRKLRSRGFEKRRDP